MTPKFWRANDRLHITEKPGEYAKGVFRLRLDPDEAKDKKSAEPFLLRNKNADGKKEPLFGGYPDTIEIIPDGGCREAKITVLSGSSLLDEEKRDRAFQTPGQGILSAADRIVKDTAHAAFILNGPDLDLKGTAIQYRETDWQFLKRLASRHNLPLVADTSYYFPRFYIGMPAGEKRELTQVEGLTYRFHKKYYELCGECPVERRDFICYHVKTGDRFFIGDHVRFEGRNLVVSEKEMELAGGEIFFRYLLTGESYNMTAPAENRLFNGMSLMGGGGIGQRRDGRAAP